MNPLDTDIPVPGNQTQLQRDIALGFDMETFRASPVGVYFAHRAKEEILSALEELRNVDPHSPHEIALFQNRIRVAERFFIWMQEAIEEGRSSAAQAEQSQQAPVDPIG